MAGHTFTIANSDNMEKYISKVLGEVDLGVQEAINATIDKIGKEGAKMVRNKSPQKGTAEYATGNYAKGWRYNATKRQADGSFSAVIHNAKYGWLTHLVEFSHPVFKKGPNGEKIVTRSKATPHVAPTQEWLNTEGVKMLSDAINQEIQKIK